MFSPSQSPVPPTSCQPLTHRFEEALVLAAQLHRHQVRKGSPVPYLSHLMAVASIVLEHGGTEDEGIGALLHDAIEDQGGLQTYQLLTERFGPHVASLVLGCTDVVYDDGGNEVPLTWRDRKAQFLQKMHGAPPSVMLIVAADKLHNLRCIQRDFRILGPEVWERFSGKRELSLWYYRSLADLLSQQAPSGSLLHHLVNEFQRILTEVETLS